MQFINAFWVGGLICVIGQLLIDLTKLTPARVMVIFLLSGVVLGAFNLYPPLVDFAGSGVTVPLCGFGNLLAKGAREAVDEQGFFGAFTGGLSATSAGISTAVSLGLFFSFFAKPREKS